MITSYKDREFSILRSYLVLLCYNQPDYPGLKSLHNKSFHAAISLALNRDLLPDILNHE
jgi:hypothetical protein